MLRHLVNWLLRPLPPTHFFALRRALYRFAGVRLADGVRFCGDGWVYGRGPLSVGADTWLSPGVILYTHADAVIAIGKDCDIGPFCLFLTGGHEPGDGGRRAGLGTARPVSIGDGCWIGARTTVLGGASIGPGCIIAAGSVVTGNIPAHSLAAGVPARVKRALA